MMNAKVLGSTKKQEIPRLAKVPSPIDVDALFRNLTEKEGSVRYNAFLILQELSRQSPIVYGYWDELEKKLQSPNSYQRNIGLGLISENVRWDNEDKFDKTFDRYILHCTDEKFITSRQAIQGLNNVTHSMGKYDKRIQQALNRLSFKKYNIGQQKLLRKDVSDVLDAIGRKNESKQGSESEKK